MAAMPITGPRKPLSPTTPGIWPRTPGPFGITANSIAPGVIATGRIMTTVIPGSGQSNRDRADLVALRRLDSVEDCARVVEFLTTDLSDYVTGAVIPIDGGLASATPQQTNRSISAFSSGSRVRNSQTVSLA